MVSALLIELMGMSEVDGDEFSKGSVVRRARREGFLRSEARAALSARLSAESDDFVVQELLLAPAA